MNVSAFEALPPGWPTGRAGQANSDKGQPFSHLI